MTDPLNKVKKSRTGHKGQCKRINSRFITESTITAEIDPRSIDGYLDAAQTAVENLTEDHEQLVELDPEKESEYDEDLAKSIEALEILQTKLRMQSRLGHACVRLERISENARNFIIPRDGHSSTLHKQLSTINLEFSKTVDDNRGIIRKDKHLADLKMEIAAELANLHSKLPAIETDISSAGRRPGEDRASGVAPVIPQHRQLPKIENPKFNGDYLKWDAFWAIFKRNIHDNPTLVDDERLSYLQQSVKDGSQHNLVDELAGSYPECLASLRSRYQKPRKLHKHYAQTFVSVPPCKDDSRKELSRVHATLNHAWRQLVGTKKITGEQLFVAVAERVLPPSLTRRWAERYPDPNIIPSMKEFTEFLEVQVDLAPEEARQEPSQRKERERKPPPTKSEPQQGTERGLFVVKHQYPCLKCRAVDHALYGCPEFMAMTVEQRSEFVTHNQLCFNCIGKGHDQRSCRSAYKCRMCGKKHHSLLHREHAAEAVTSETMVTESVHAVAHHSVAPNTQEEATVLTVAPTMGVVVSSPGGQATKVTALFDGGATISVITNRVVNRLRLKRHRCHMNIVQALGKSTLTNTATVQLTVKSAHRPGETRQFTAVVVPTIGQSGTGRQLDAQWEALKVLPLADPTFMTDKTIDLIIGQNASAGIYLDRRQRNPDNTLSAQETIWGWTVEGRIGRPQRLPNQETTAIRTLNSPTIAAITIKKLQEDTSTNELLQRFFEDEEQSSEITQSLEDQHVLDHFKATHCILPNGRYQVSLPRRQDCDALGTSRGQAMQRYLQNEKSLIRRKGLQPFQTVMSEYFELNHAETIPVAEIKKEEQYYMPMHAVIKATSTSTKLRVVFDASASTSSGKSLNDTLLTGPTVYPPLTSILVRFRTHRIGMAADISKMYREVALDPNDRDLHRFLWRKSPTDPILDCRMTRVTFGVASSPFMATQVLQQISVNNQAAHPAAALALHRDFYVDDYISGADQVEDAINLQTELCGLLGQHQLTLRKWRSSNRAVLRQLPKELCETETVAEPYGHRHHLKTLGVLWNATEDVFHIAISELTLPPTITKRALTSDVARTFDVLGWFSPATFTMKTLIQKLWAAKTGWDDQVPEAIQTEWTQWRTELPMLAEQPIPRKYFQDSAPANISLHGFADASVKGYAAVIYIRATYQDHLPSVTLVQSKTKVAPLKGSTIPRLELCAAALLATLLATVRTALGMTVQQTHCWTDSQIVLFWLDGKTRPHRTYVANRVRQTLEQAPSHLWKHVPGVENPADCASRGITPAVLRDHPLWWHGPTWLAMDPIPEPPQPTRQPDTNDLELIKNKTVATLTIVQDIFEQRYSAYSQLVRTIAWIWRFRRNTTIQKAQRPERKELSVADLQTAEIVLYKRAQKRMMASTSLSQWVRSKMVRSLNPTVDRHGIYRVNGRLQNSGLEYAQRHPIVLEGKDVLTKLIIRDLHIRNGHAGPTLLMSALGRNHYVLRGLVTVKALCHQCVTCRRHNLTTEVQMMGQLPKARVTPSRPFAHVGTDFAGPFTIKRGHTRKPTLIKAYVCVFVCLATKAVHLEMVSDLSTGAFMSCLSRFVGRRGLPTNIHSDNGTNYVGASRELEAIYSLMRQEETQQAVTRYCSSVHISWHFSPARAPHFGGIWEAAVKSFKTHFRRMSNHRTFSFEEMATILITIEAVLNSRPLLPVYNHSEEGIDTLTPGHFLIGQPLNALPEEKLLETRSFKSKFLQGQQLCHQFWHRWSADYLQQLHKRPKWQKPAQNVAVGDVVLIRGEQNYRLNDWPMARVTKVYHGQDGLVRTVDLQNGQRMFTRPIVKLTILVSPTNDEESSAEGEEVSDAGGTPLTPAGMSESEDSELESEPEVTPEG